MELLEVKNVKKVYYSRMGGQQCIALSNVNFTVEEGEYVAIMGPSGSGKTTLLNILASLDKPTQGDIFLSERNMVTIKERELAAFRRDNLGFVFQDFNLLDSFTAKDNILLPLVLSKMDYKKMEKKLMPIVKELEIQDILDKYPYEISGGQKQRTAIARAIIADPKLLLADEPTGALDSKASKKILTIFERLNTRGQTIVMVTHSSLAASHASRVLFIKDGEVFSQIHRGDEPRQEFFNHIINNLSVLSDGGVDVG